MRNPIFDIDNWKEILATLGRNKTRTFLTGFGIFWGTAMLAMLWGGAQGLQDILRRNFAGLSTNMAIVWPEPTSIPYRGFAKGMYWQMNMTDVENLSRSIPEIEAVAAMSTRSSSVSYGRHGISSRVRGLNENFEAVFSPIIYEGRYLNADDIRTSRKICVIGKEIADEFFPGESALGKKIEVNDVFFTVVGVMGQKGEVSINGRAEESVDIPSTTYGKLYNQGDKVGTILYIARQGSKPADFADRVRRVIARNHPISPDDPQALEIMDVSEQFEMVDGIFQGVDILALIVGICSLLAGIIGVGNIMWVIVKERTQEIGIRRALGAKPRDIIVQILSESTVLTVVAGTAGICFATVILSVAAMITADGSDVAGFQLDFNVAVLILVLFLTLGTAAGIIPALKAMHIKPIEALNDK